MAPQQRPSKVFIFDMTRYRSHLFFRFACTHPEIEPAYHPFMRAFFLGPERVTFKTKNNEARMKENEIDYAPFYCDVTYEMATENFLKRVREAEQKGKVLLANEHCQMILKQEIGLGVVRDAIPEPLPPNPTVIPDEIFDDITPIFVIRNPIYAMPSNWTGFSSTTKTRPGDEDWGLITNQRSQRLVFDTFHQKFGKPPIVVDGDDVLWRTDEVRKGVCEALGLDPQGLSDTWETLPEELQDTDPLIRAMTTTINDSTGIERPEGGKPKDMTLDEAAETWKGKYGEEVAGQLKEAAERNMVHYRHMSQFKV